MSATSAASTATSVPVPIAMPTSACASAGASLMPSPTIATTRPIVLQPAHLGDLAVGQHAGDHVRDACLARDGVRRVRMVAAQHHDVEPHRRAGAGSPRATSA